MAIGPVQLIVLGFSHPEFHGEIVKGYIHARREILQGEGLDPDALHAAATDAPQATRMLRNFVTQVIPR